MSSNPSGSRSISFDRAAGFYDRTRGHDPQVSRQVADTFVSLVPPPARLLEIGIGTGRIAIPLLERGYAITGIDLSRRMVARLRQNLPPGLAPVGLVEGNAGYLPFRASAFEAVVAVHVFHLVAEWRQAVAEIHKVLYPVGSLLHGYDWRPVDSPPSLVRDQWRAILHQHEPQASQPGVSHLELDEQLQKMGATIREHVAAEWVTPYRVSEHIKDLADGIYSASWQAPDDRRAQYIEELRRWAQKEFQDLDQVFQIPRRFIWQQYTWS